MSSSAGGSSGSLASSGRRSKAEELALRRAQLERRAARQRPASAEPRRAETMRATADDALDASAAAQRTASYEEAEHAAKEQARVEKQARASAERRSNEMALRALEAERTKRLEAEKLLALERSYSAQLLSKIDVRDRRKYRRTQAVIAIQAAWRGYWARQCLLAGKQELERQAAVVQSCFRGFKARRGAMDEKRRQSADQLKEDYLTQKRNATRTESLRPTGVQQTFVFDDASPGTSLAALGMELGSHLTVDAVAPRGPAAARGVGLGMRLVACGDVSTLGTPLDAVAGLLARAGLPMQLTFESMGGPEHTGRTLFQLVDQIKTDLGLDAELGVADAVDAACAELHISREGSLHEQVLSLAVQLGVELD